MDPVTIKQLRKILNNIPPQYDNCEVVYERIDDFYFDEGNWEPLILSDMITDGWKMIASNGDQINNEVAEYISVYGIYFNEKEKVLKLTAHF